MALVNYDFDKWSYNDTFNLDGIFDYPDHVCYFKGGVIKECMDYIMKYDPSLYQHFKNELIHKLFLMKQLVYPELAQKIVRYDYMMFDYYIVSFNPHCGPLEKFLEIVCDVNIICLRHKFPKLYFNEEELSHLNKLEKNDKYHDSQYALDKINDNLKYFRANDLINDIPEIINNCVLIVDAYYITYFGFDTVSIIYYSIIKKLSPLHILLAGNTRMLSTVNVNDIYTFTDTDRTNVICYKIDKCERSTSGMIGFSSNILMVLTKV